MPKVVFSMISLLMLCLTCGGQTSSDPATEVDAGVDSALWEEGDAIAGLRDYFISISHGTAATGQLQTVLLTHDWQAEYTHGGWWVVKGPFLGRALPEETAPVWIGLTGNKSVTESLEDYRVAKEAFDAKAPERAALVKEQLKGTWRISERTRSVLPVSTSTQTIISVLTIGAHRE